MKLGKQLSFSRSINPSICIFNWLDKENNQFPLEISAIDCVGQKEGFAEVYTSQSEIKAAATPSALAMGNLHTIEYCHAPFKAQSVNCEFSIRVESNFMSPSRVDDKSAKEALEQFAHAYKKKDGLKYLAKRYVMNICNGSWLWRNQNTLNTTIYINVANGFSTSDVLNFTINHVQQRRFTGEWNDVNENIERLANEVSEALYDPRKYCSINVKAELKTGFMQEVHPSQAFVNKSDKVKASRVYQSTKVDDKRVAIMGCFKVGAAIQTIDDWYPMADKPLRVGSYGVDKETTSTHRHPSTQLDLYSQLKKLESLTAELESTHLTGEHLPNNMHFVAACMIKGGMFQQGVK